MHSLPGGARAVEGAACELLDAGREHIFASDQGDAAHSQPSPSTPDKASERLQTHDSPTILPLTATPYLAIVLPWSNWRFAAGGIPSMQAILCGVGLGLRCQLRSSQMTSPTSPSKLMRMADGTAIKPDHPQLEMAPGPAIVAAATASVDPAFVLLPMKRRWRSPAFVSTRRTTVTQRQPWVASSWSSPTFA